MTGLVDRDQHPDDKYEGNKRQHLFSEPTFVRTYFI